MRYALAIAINDLRVYLSDRGNIIGLLVLPLIMTFVLGFAFSGTNSSTSLPVDVIDLDASELSQQFIVDLRAANPALVLCPMDREVGNCNLDEDTVLDVETSIDRVRNINTASLIVIPEGYAEAIENFESAAVEYYAASNAALGDAILPAVQSVVQRVNGSIVAARIGVGLTDALATETSAIFTDNADRDAFADKVYDTANTMWTDQPVVYKTVVSGTGEVDPQAGTQSGFGQSVPGMATMFVMFTVLGGAALLMRERQQWTLQRVVVMPVPKSAIIGGKILGRFLLGIVQFLIVFVIGVVIGLDFGNDPVAIVVVILSYTLAVTAIGMIFASFIENEAQANGLTTLISIAFAGLGGAWWPLSIVPEFMRVIGHFTPVAWAMDAFTKLIFENAGLGDILVEVAILLAIAAVGFVIGVAAFKYE